MTERLRAEGDAHADVGGVALAEAAVAAVGRVPSLSVAAGGATAEEEGGNIE